jgi:hypothetical protein
MLIDTIGKLVVPDIEKYIAVKPNKGQFARIGFTGVVLYVRVLYMSGREVNVNAATLFVILETGTTVDRLDHSLRVFDHQFVLCS